MSNNSQQVEDTYFLYAGHALHTATKQNRIGPYGNLQLCYYDGNPLANAPKNCIHLPLDQICAQLINATTRIPTMVDNCIGATIGHEHKHEHEHEHEHEQPSNRSQMAIAQIRRLKIERENLHEARLHEIKNISLNFNEPLRVYIATERYARVVRRAYESIRDSFLELGVDVLFDMDTEIEELDDFRRVKAIAQWKPHITVNINRLRNEYIPNDTFNFVWFQDPTLMLFDDTVFSTRARDHFFYLADELKVALQNKGIPDKKLTRQGFSADYQFYFENKSIKKENKVVFIGSNYFNVVNPTISYKNHHTLITSLTDQLRRQTVTCESLQEMAKNYKSHGLRRQEHLEMFVFPAVVRLEVVKWLCSQNQIDVEVYGDGWDDVEGVSSHHKGVLKYGKEVADILNSAKYSLAAHAHFFYQQRLMEASACNCISLMYNVPTNREPFHHFDNVLIFNTRGELHEQIGKIPTQDCRQISKDISYQSFTKKMIELVNNRNHPDHASL